MAYKYRSLTNKLLMAGSQNWMPCLRRTQDSYLVWPTKKKVSTLPETNSSHLKMDGWKMYFLLGFGRFSGAFAVSFREGNYNPWLLLVPLKGGITSQTTKFKKSSAQKILKNSDTRVSCWK